MKNNLKLSLICYFLDWWC